MTENIACTAQVNSPDANPGIKVMNGRHFSGMVLEAYIADGNEKFKKSSEKKAAAIEEEDEDGEEGKRLDQFGTWLEGEAGAPEE